MYAFNYEIITVLIILLLLIGALNKSSNFLTLLLILTGIIFFLIYCNQNWHLEILNWDTWKLVTKSLLIMSGLGIWVIWDKNDKDGLILLMWTLIGSLMLISAEHMLLIYLCLELQTFSLFVLISKNRKSMLSTEAGLKYFILGAISSGLFLLAISLLYGQGITLNINDIIWNKDFNTTSNISHSLLLISLLFKLTAVPFHMWAPDVYEGAQANVVALVATIPKISVLVLILNLGITSDLILVAAALSLIVGTLGALNQTKIKRLMAYSGISHIGFILMGVGIHNNYGVESTYIYLIIYIIMVISSFSIIINSPLKNELIIEFGMILKKNKTLATSWAILLLSIAGIPPLAGFVSKWAILWVSLNYQYIIISIIAIICSIIAAAYYLRIVKIIYFQQKSNYLVWQESLSINNLISIKSSLWLGVSIYFILFMLIHPQPWLLLSHWGVSNLF